MHDRRQSLTVIHPITVNTMLYCRHWNDMVRFYSDRLSLPVTFSKEWFMEFRLAHQARLSIADERRASVKSAAGNSVTLTLEVQEIEPVHKQMEVVIHCPSRRRCL
jgi:hypothetical protein